MDVFIAGAGGAIGRALIPLLVAEGHTVTGTTTTAAKRAAIEALGARAVVMDGLDARSVMDAVRAARPDVLLHQMTALGGQDMTKMDRAFATTNRLRTEGLDHLLAAAAQLDTPPRVIVQSFAGVPLARTGDRVKDETAPLDPDPPKGMRETVAAFRAMEARATQAGAIVLRYGGFYGPHTGLTASGEQAELLRRRRFPSSAAARACGRSCTSRTPPRRPSPPSSAGARARSTTSSTTSPRPSASGCRSRRAPPAPSRRSASPRGSGASPPAPPRCS